MSLTCLSCLVTFPDADSQRNHYRGDWHRYNLRRKVAGVAPVGEEEYTGRVEAQQQRTREEAGKAAFQKACEACGKTYNSENGYNSHLESRRHKENVAGLASSESAPAASSAEPLPADNEPVEQEPEAMEIETTKQPNWKHLIASAESETELESLLARKRAAAPRLAPTACLFCPATSDSPEENLEHMSKSHSFFVPFLENVVDVPGLLERLGEIITLENFCLWCGDSGKRMYDMDSVRRHMLDLGHCRIGEVVEEACEEFWSFDSEDGQLIAFEPTVEEGHLQLGNSRTAIPRSLARFYKQNLLPSQVHAKVTQSYKLLGYKDSPLEERKKRHAQRLETRAKLGWEKKMGERGNGLMKHFRIQIPF